MGPSTTAPDPTLHWRPFVEGLRRFVARRVPAQDADDVAQEVMVRLHQGAASLRDAERAESWVFAVARRTIADYYRSRGANPTAAGGEPADELADPGALPAKGFGRFAGGHSAHEEVLSWLRPMAEELPETYREPLLLADFEGVPQAEIARRLGLSLSGAKSRVQRARTLLGEHLARCCEVELDSEGRVADFRRRECDC
ncbi:MAG TPA: sigma-70 family RNA polymerase sigma factor [Thermoanaerobaculia bacterium]|nr:sigma-70 family RNA polymerase sigma factor [Thermoanaerobaculia bacterium]